jgi:alpha-amylase
MKSLKRYALAVTVAMLSLFSAKAAGWPANYEGVMLQGFYWDSYTDTKWTNLESQADELSQYFKLIWVPNSARDAQAGGQSMGYTPVYWFTNHNTCFGTEAQLRSMIATYKAKGTGIIADVVINHRNGKSNWTDFPSETWNGTTWKIGPEGICCTDEVKDASGQATPTGAADTGEDFSGSRDLDHTNANVQNNCKNYCKCLLEDYGYAGFRYDMAKGYGGQYTKIYNQYANPTYSVGEYWDGSYDAVAAWIEATGKTSAAFDFPFKYAVNEAFASNDMTKLVWKANGTTNQPAGLIHYGYPQYAVTFVENHDTATDGSAFTGNVVAANAFMLCSPGTPCVFLSHWKQYTSEIKQLIAIRNAVGVSNTSAVTVLQSSTNCYMAEVTGSNGKLVVKVGSAMVSPSGYSNSDIKASGTDYCVWTKTGVSGGGSSTTTYPATLYLAGNVNSTGWSTSSAVAADTAADGVYTWNSVTFDASSTTSTDSYFTFLTATGASWDVVNQSDRYGASSADEAISSTATIVKYAANVSASGALSWKATAGTYKVVADLTTMKLTISAVGGGTGGGDDPVTNDVYVFLKNTSSWSTPCVWAWNASGNQVAATAWPGDKMTLVSDNIWRWDLPAGKSEPTQIIFSNNGNSQTADLTYQNGKTYDCSGNIVTDTPTPNPNPDPTYPTALYLVGNVNSTAWSTSAGVSATGTNGVYTWDSVTIDASSADSAEGYFTFVTALGASWDEVNLSDRYGASTKDEAITSTATIVKYEANVSASGAYSWKAAAGTYKVVADLSTMTLTITKSGDTPTPNPGNYPEHIYMVGNVNGTSWATSTGLAPDTAVNGIYTWNSVNFGAASSDWPYGYFTFLTALDEIDGDWNGANQADRYGAPAADTEIVANSPSTVKLYAYMVDAMAAQSWKVTPGAYKTVLDLTAMTVTISLPTGIDEIAAEAADADVEYYNLQGVRVENPTPGIYIVRRAGKVTKEIVR